MIFEPNKQTTWNTSHLHAIAWSSGKVDNEKRFAVFYDIKVRNAEVFAKELETCRLLTRLLGQNGESLDDYGFQKFRTLLEKEKRTVRGSALVIFSGREQGCSVPRGNQRCMENGLCNICKRCKCFLYLCLILN